MIEPKIGPKISPMIRTLAFAAAIFVTAGHSADAQVLAALDPVRPKLKAETLVTGDIVRIGDLVDDAGIVAKVPIFRSPDLGATGSVSAQAVVEAVREHALIALDTGGVEEVLVIRATRTVEPQEIADTVAAALASQFALGPAKDVAVNFDRELRPLHLEPSAKGAARVTRISYDLRSTRFDVTLDVPGRSAMRLSGKARAMVDVVTVARPIARGEIIQQADILHERRARNEAGRDIITDQDQALGMAVRNGMQPGRPMRTADLMKPETVQRHETVTLVYEVPGITLTVRGKALQGGADGDVISVLNEQSKRTVQGAVAGPGRVVIGTRGPQLAANLMPAGERADANTR